MDCRETVLHYTTQRVLCKQALCAASHQMTTLGRATGL